MIKTQVNSITRNKELREKESVCRKVDKCKTILNSLSRAIYPAFSLEISDKITKFINNINFTFILKNKCQYIRRADVVKRIEEGGLNAIDFLYIGYE